MGTVEHEVAAARAAGRRLGPYVLLDELGRGGMGVVVRAFDERRRAAVALKLLDPAVVDREASERLAREGRAVAALDHPGVVRVLEAGEVEGRPYVALELVEGAPLGERLPPRGDLGLAGAVRVLRDVAAALAHAHQRGVVHRDLKPSNIIVDGHGHGRLIDFGLARLAHDRARLTATGVLLGTPGFMAPEQANGQAARAGPPADVWGLGALLYLALTGRPPFLTASVMTTLRAIIEDAPDPLVRAGGPDEPELAALALSCLAKDEAARPTADEVELALARWLDPSRPRVRPARARRAPGGRAGALVAVAAAAGGALLLARGARPAAPLPEGPPAPVASAAPTGPSPTEAAAAAVVTRAERAPRSVTAPLEERLRAAFAVDDLERAAALLGEAMSRWPDDPSLLCARANICWRRGELEAALRDAERAAEVAPEDPGSHSVLGVVCSALGRRARALRELDRAVELATALGDRWLLRQTRLARARAQRRVHAMEGALDDTAAALRVDPADALALSERALTLLEAGRREEAWALCEQLLGPREAEPTIAPAVIRCAIAVGELAQARRVQAGLGPARSPALSMAQADLAFAGGDLAAAQAHLLRALGQDPGDASTWTLLANVLARRGDGPGALQAAETSARLGEPSAEAWDGLSVELLGARRPAEALTAMERSLALAPDRPDAQLGRAALLLRLGDLRAAERHALALVRADPARPRGWAVLAMSRTRLGDLDGAQEALRQTVDLVAEAGAIDPLLLAATAELALAHPGRDDEAEAAVRDLLARRPELPEGHWLSALLRLRRGDAAGAAAEATLALDLPAAPRGGLLADPWTVRALARAALGDAAGALADADEAVALRPRASAAYAARAEVHRRRGDLARAQADLARARALDGGRP